MSSSWSRPGDGWWSTCTESPRWRYPKDSKRTGRTPRTPRRQMRARRPTATRRTARSATCLEVVSSPQYSFPGINGRATAPVWNVFRQWSGLKTWSRGPTQPTNTSKRLTKEPPRNRTRSSQFRPVSIETGQIRTSSRPMATPVDGAGSRGSRLSGGSRALGSFAPCLGEAFATRSYKLLRLRATVRLASRG